MLAAHYRCADAAALARDSAAEAAQRPRRLALVAEGKAHDEWRPVGIARLADTGKRQAELAVAVADAWQRWGVGRRLLEELGERAAELGYRELYGDVLPENRVIVRLLQRVFPGAMPRWQDDVVRVHCPSGRCTYRTRTCSPP